jgi:CelD/BcsL family acetyltransferase involved in cellulose biosynthesis
VARSRNAVQRRAPQRFRRAAARQFGPLFAEIIAPDAAEFDALFDEAIAVELASWKREAGTAIASCPEKGFLPPVSAQCRRAGTLRIAFLRVDRRAIAMQLAIESGGAWWLFKIGFDESFARCSPGSLLMHTIGHAARSGLARYELLGEVEPWIAQLWTREEHPTLRVRTYPFGLRGAAALVQDGAFWLGERLRRRI